MQPHFPVHRRRDQDFGARIERQRHTAQGVIGDTKRQFGHRVRCGRRDEQQVRFVGQFDVRRLPALLFLEEIGDHRMAGQGLERHRGDEPQRIRGHHDVHITALLGEQAR